MCLQALRSIPNSVTSVSDKVAELQHLQISQLFFLKGGLPSTENNVKCKLDILCHQYLSVLLFVDFTVHRLGCVIRW